MGRRKKFYKAKVPFVKLKFKVNRQTFFNIIGLGILLVAFITLLSFTGRGELLAVVNQEVLYRLGRVALFLPIFLFLVSSHFFSTKKLNLIKPHVTLGFFLIMVAVLGVFRSGQYGNLIIDGLVADFSFIGAFIILLITAVAGIILFFDTSLDVFLLILISITTKTVEFMKMHVFRNVSESLAKKKSEVPAGNKGEKDMFIRDSSIIERLRRKSDGDKSSQNDRNKAVGEDGLLIKPFSSADISSWEFPPLEVMTDVQEGTADYGDVSLNSHTIEETLDSFGIRAKVAEVNKGPTVTQYALEIVRGTKLSKITALGNDMALALAAPTGQVRIEAPIPGRSLVGIEIPNRKAQLVTMRNLLNEPIMERNENPLLVPLGLDVSGKAVATDITRMPHMLIAGTTGSGKSVLLNVWIATILYRATPEEVRVILVDPKRVEMSVYNGIPHLLTEVIVEPKKIISALKWTVKEMESRYKLFAKMNARNILSYNTIKGVDRIPYLLFIIDELADLMVFAPGEVEELITRIAQMARATGIHLLLATQRPSVDVITGLMKANIPARVAFNVASMIDSRVVLDTPGAEKLLGKGDMLFLPPDQARPKRIQGPFISESDVQRLVEYFKQKGPRVDYTEEVTEQEVEIKSKGLVRGSDGEKDLLFEQALSAIMESNQASASFLQRRLSIGYTRAARILDQLEEDGYVGTPQGSKPRDILSRKVSDSVDVEE